MSLDSLITVNISTLTTGVSRAGFGTPLICSYFPTSVFPGRVKEYSSLSEMTDDGFLTTDAAYKMASKLKSQNPSVTSWKVGRRANAPVQTFQLVPTVTTEGQVLSLDAEGTEVSYTIPASASVASIVAAMDDLLWAISGVNGVDNTTYVGINANRLLSNTVTVTTEANTEVFTILLDGTTYAYTSDASATKTEIRDGLKALIDADPNANVTTANNSTDAIDFTCNTHRGFAMEVVNPATGVLTKSVEVTASQLLDIGNLSTGLTLEDTSADPGLTADLNAILAEDADWYGLLIDTYSQTDIAAAAAWTETNKKLFVYGTIDSEVWDSGVSDDVMSTLQGLAYARSLGVYVDDTQSHNASAWMGKIFPKDPGSVNWAYKTLSGVTVSNLTTAQVNTILGKNGNVYYLEGGVNITYNGKVASGTFADLTRGVDWMKARIQERLYLQFVNRDKLPFTQTTADLIESELRAQFLQGLNNGFLAPDTEDTPWGFTVPPPASVSTANKIARTWPGIEASATLAGAVNTLTINITLSV